MAVTNINGSYSTPHSKNAWAFPATEGAWRKVQGLSTDGVSNTFLLLALARANGKTANVFTDATTNEITAVYL